MLRVEQETTVQIVLQEVMLLITLEMVVKVAVEVVAVMVDQE